MPASLSRLPCPCPLTTSTFRAHGVRHGDWARYARCVGPVEGRLWRAGTLEPTEQRAGISM
eukprot:5519588-Alexandrium_andersonii.AAC.1